LASTSYGGTMDIRSKIEVGTVVTLTFPSSQVRKV
jgi:signal transduction histidine kinase